MKPIQIDPYRWEIPQHGAMRVPARIFATPDMMTAIHEEEALKQLTNVAQLPGILKAAMAMPDIHWGYGFPIGGVAAFDVKEGVISPGGVGYDINCGVRLAVTHLTDAEVVPRLPDLVNALFSAIPSGVGSTGDIRLTDTELKSVLKKGSRWAVERGYGEASDLERTEEKGCMTDADPRAVSNKALDRGRKQIGTLGSGNHFVEIGVVDEIFDEKTAAAFGLAKNRVTILLHSGSRGLGHQTCDDALAAMTRKGPMEGFALPDRQLACARIQSPSGEQYYQAMACAANFAWANRQTLMHLAAEAMMRALSVSPRSLGLRLVYDVSHNIGKKETHTIDGIEKNLIMHRKGATRAFGPGRPEIPVAYRHVGQPVLIPGTMGTASYVLVGTAEGMNIALGSSCHGAGRRMSRMKAKHEVRGSQLRKELEAAGIIIRSDSDPGLAEEAPIAYKDVEEVVNVVQTSRLANKVARLKPLAVIKGE